MDLFYISVLAVVCSVSIMEILKSFIEAKDSVYRLMAFLVSYGVTTLCWWVFETPETFKSTFLYAPAVYFLQEVFDVDILKNLVKKSVLNKLSNDGLDVDDSTEN